MNRGILVVGRIINKRSLILDICKIIVIINLTFMFFQDQSKAWTAASQQHKVDNQPLAT